MSHQWMRCNLAATIFPFASPLSGRTIIVPQYDQNYEKTLVSSADTDKDKGIPQALYMHNVMPQSHGYQAIGYDTYIPAMSGNPTDFDQIFPIQDPTLARCLFVPAGGKNYIYDAVVGHWASVSPIANLPATVVVTVSLVQGQSYIFYARNNCYKYNITTKLLDTVALLGLTVANLNGLVAANGYLIAYNDTNVSWSSQSNPLDFVPSLATGAGGGSVNEIKGKIICCLPIANGFIVYCEKNIVAARYTGNARFPYNFRELPGSGGIASPEQVSWQSNLAEHYAWTTAGLQKITIDTCMNLVPEVTDFLSMLLFEDFDEDTRTFTELLLSTPLSIKIAAVAGRYLSISYGVSATDFTHALMFDLTLKRWGKLKINHRDCFQWNAPNLYGELTYDQLLMTYDGLGQLTTYDDLSSSINSPEYVRKTVCYLQQDGTVKAVNFDFSQTAANGVLMIGKFQFQRNRFIEHQQTDIENINEGLGFSYLLMPTLDGKTFEPMVVPKLVRNKPYSKRYGKKLSGQNVTAVFLGAFNLTSCLFNFTLGREW